MVGYHCIQFFIVTLSEILYVSIEMILLIVWLISEVSSEFFQKSKMRILFLAFVSLSSSLPLVDNQKYEAKLRAYQKLTNLDESSFYTNLENGLLNCKCLKSIVDKNIYQSFCIFELFILHDS